MAAAFDVAATPLLCLDRHVLLSSVQTKVGTARDRFQWHGPLEFVVLAEFYDEYVVCTRIHYSKISVRGKPKAILSRTKCFAVDRNLFGSDHKALVLLRHIGRISGTVN